MSTPTTDQTIDHAQEARALTRVADSLDARGPGAPDLLAQILGSAQVHATLALAHEQRTANLLALAALRTVESGPARALASHRLGLID